MLFRQLYDQETSTYTYLLADEDSKEAVIIDSVLEQVERDQKLIKELQLNLKYILETHVHADHITGATELKKSFPNAKTIVHSKGGVECADIHSTDGMEIKFGKYYLKVLSTPGHTNGCVSYYTEGMVFTGDALLIRGCGRTDFQQGDPSKLYDSITQKIFTLPDNTLVYPGHDYKGFTCSSVWEEKKYNPRLANKTKDEFILIMNNLNLPYPKKIQESVPANLKCGNIKLSDA
ncbi:MAG: Zn-dependent hydrolase [Candidatus Sericytochromatia bacterium]|nr:MAG: Zn-dependent hydrolase [Candidatus Sericytochromatia bacterium]